MGGKACKMGGTIYACPKSHSPDAFNGQRVGGIAYEAIAGLGCADGREERFRSWIQAKVVERDTRQPVCLQGKVVTSGHGAN